MAYGFSIPARGPLANPESIVALATRGEALGFGWLAVPDHIVIPRSIGSRYPYSDTGAFPGGRSGETLEQFAILAFLAGTTRTARLLTSVMVVPHRPAVLAAKALASIDVLSGGRVTVGCGAGWLEEEFDVVAAPPFAERGRVTDEYLSAFKRLWTEDDPRIEGAHVSYADSVFLPKPVQRPHPPLWIGGESGPAIRRAARLGDAWYPIGANPRHPLNTRERYAAGIGRLRAECERIGRDPAGLELVYWANWYGTERATDDGSRHLFTGSDADVVDDIGALAELGATHQLFNFQRETLDASLDAMHRFSEEVLTKVG